MKRWMYLQLIIVLTGAILIALGILAIYQGSSVWPSGLIDRLGDEPIPASNLTGPDSHMIGIGVLMTVVGTIAVSVSSTVIIVSRKRKGV